MSKFNKTQVKPAAKSFIVTDNRATIRTHEGAPAYTRDSKSELFLLAVSNMGSEDTFYESGKNRDSRFAGLIRTVAVADPVWMAGFLGWLRSDGNMRTASLMGALEAASAMVAAKLPGSRQIVDSVLQRADEPGEAVAYWLATYGKKLPKPVKRGIADAATRLYTEYSMLKYDTSSHAVRFADVLDLTHPDPKAMWQGDLFKHALDRRHGRGEDVPESLHMVRLNKGLRDGGNDPKRMLDPEVLKQAGMTWEDVLSLLGSKVDKKKLWEAIIPSMGYMALLRNLRNFDETGVSDAVAQQVIARLQDPDQVARSRQFPFRFLSAFEQAPSLRWGYPLETALKHSLKNIPKLPGKTLVLVDTSGSMSGMNMSAKSKMTPARIAAVFGVALAQRGNDVDLYGFADGTFRHDVNAGASVLKEVDRFNRRSGERGHGTDIPRAVRETFRGHDRVFVISDMQTRGGGYYAGDPASLIPATTPWYGFNLGGYKPAAVATGNFRHEFGGLTDTTFRMIPLLEAGHSQTWPWSE